MAKTLVKDYANSTAYIACSGGRLGRVVQVTYVFVSDIGRRDQCFSQRGGS